MTATKIERKIRFLPYLPYGFCSRYATTIEGKSNPQATQLLLGDNPTETLDKCEQHRVTTLDKAKYLCDKKYARESKRLCGVPEKKRSFRFLTREGLIVLTEAPEQPTQDREATKAHDGKIKESYFRSNSQSSIELREMLYDYASYDNEEERKDFASLLLDAVVNGNVTPLSYAIRFVNNATISTDKYSQNQLYSIWRLSHVNAMFRVNGYLTCLDRRPYDTGFAIDGITDADSYHAYIEKYGYTPAALTYHALTNWYRDNPGYYQITQQYPDDSPEAKAAWLKTPAFYSALELPNLGDKKTVIAEGEMQDGGKKLNAIHIGLAMGKKLNYLCYHGRPGEFGWNKKREAQAKTEMQRAIHHMKTLNPQMTNQEAVEFGLYFCSSYHQFLTLFSRTKDRHKKGLHGDFLTDKPFTSLHAIPVNDSGAFLLWCLMEMSPIETEERICSSLVDMDIGFEHQTNRYYPLTYNGKRVFPGYTMDVSKINHVLEDYLSGGDFYICCFPNQAAWYQKLFPKLTIL